MSRLQNDATGFEVTLDRNGAVTEILLPFGFGPDDWPVIDKLFGPPLSLEAERE